MKARTVATSLAALATALAQPVFAQTSPQAQATADDAAGQGGISEIVVTAQKRAENVQDVPISISAFTAAALRERAVGDVAQLSNITPNVSLDAGTPFSGSTSVLSAYIRGIGQNDFAMNLDPGVGVYLDGVYLARTVGANLDLPDVERIEVLKGPQGTLFGRNTIGGAVSVTTRDPGNELSFRGDVTTGRYNRLDIRGSVDLPLAESLKAAVTFSSKHRDGYQKRIPFPSAGPIVTDSPSSFGQSGYQTSEREGGTSDWTLRGKLKWEATDRLVVRLTGDYSKMDQSSMANSLLATTEYLSGPFGGTTNIPGTAFDPSGQTGFLFTGLYNFCIGATPGEIAARGAGNICGPRGTPLNPSRVLGGLGSVNVDADPSNNRLPYDSRFLLPNKDETYATGNSFSKMKSWGITLALDYDMTDALSVKSITGYRDLKWRSGLDLDGSPLQILEPSFALSQWQFSQELQLNGKFLDDKLNFVVGGYYFKEKGEMDDYVNFSAGLLQIHGPNVLETENYAFFGQADYRPIDLIGITLGARYTHEDKVLNAGQTDENGFNYKLFNCPVYGDPCSTALGFTNPSQPLRSYVTPDQFKKFSNFSPKVGVQLHPMDDLMVYGSWSKGYKAGGWTTRLQNPLPFAPDFGPEKATTWEVGIKSEPIRSVLQINAAAFTTKYDGIQLNFQLATSPTIQNAGTARIKGFELETVFAPSKALMINASVGYTDARYTSVLPQAITAPDLFRAGVFNGAELPKTPKWKFNISPRYQLDLNDLGALVLLVDYTHTTKVWNDTERTFLLQRPSTDVLNLSATYKAPDEVWQLTVGGTNVTNERYIVTGQSQAFGSQQIYGTWSRPTEWYATLGVKF